MSIRSYLPKPDTDHLAVSTDILEDWPQHIAREHMIPSIAKKTRNALNTVPLYVEHFQRIKRRRRCSCFNTEADPSGTCPLCYGYGDVGGYQKRGTYVEVFDVTYPGTVIVNAAPDYYGLKRPVNFTLPNSPKALRGTIEFTWNPKANIGVLDDLYLIDNGNVYDGVTVTYWVRTPNDPEWIPLTESSLIARISLGKPFRVGVSMSRERGVTEAPVFTGIRCAYRTHKYTAIRADIPRTNRSRTLDDFGIYESFTAQNFALGNDVKSVDNDDFFMVIQDQTKWKVQEWQDNRILGMNTSWDVTCRLIQSADRLQAIRTGRLDLLDTQFPSKSVRSIQTEETVFVNKGLTHGRLPGQKADIERAQSVSVGVAPGQLIPNPTPEK